MKTEFWKRASISLFCVAALISSARADYIPPDKVEIHTEKAVPDAIKFETGHYVYDITWQGLPVGTAELYVRELPTWEHKALRVEATAKTASGIDLFYKLRHLSEGIFRVDHFRPVKFTTVQTENSKEKGARVNFGEDGTIKARAWKTGKGGEESSQISFLSENQTLDPISAAFLARSLPIEKGKRVSFDVFNGKHRYLIEFEVEGVDKVSIDGKQVDAFKVVPTVKKLTDSEGEKRIKSAALWITADSRRDIVKLESKVVVGRISAKLALFEPIPTPPSALPLQAKLEEIDRSPL